MKTKSTFKVLFLSLGLATTAMAQVPTNGLIGYWPFNGNANDVSNNGHNGTVAGATLTADRFGNANSAYSFNGTSNSISLGSKLSYNTHTLSIWGNTSTSSSFCNPCNVLMSKIGNTSTNKNCELRGPNMFVYGDGSAYNFVDFNSSQLKLGTWYHIVVTYDSIQNKASIYLNGKFQNTVTGKSLATIANQTTVIGARPSGGGLYFNGLIDDARVYNRVLNNSEILALYNEGICYQSINVTDTLFINANLAGFNPLKYESTIRIYPNPTKDHITIDYGNYSTLSGYTFKITNSLGQTVFTTTINQQQSYVDLNGWSGNGIYFAHLIDSQSNTIDIRKIVIQ